jgi:glc operon protein GlcG
MIKTASLDLEEARKIVDAVVEAARSTKPPDRPMSVAVVDNAGVLLSFARMDGASPNTARMAINKAFTAIYWRRDTAEMQNWIKDGRDISWFGDPFRNAPIPGGVLIKSSDGYIVGAIGTSGRAAMGPMGDEELAQIGAKAFRV